MSFSLPHTFALVVQPNGFTLAHNYLRFLLARSPKEPYSIQFLRANRTAATMSDVPIKAEPGLVESVDAAPPTVNESAETSVADDKTDVAKEIAAEENGSGEPNILKTTRQVEKDHKKNNKFDPKTQVITDDPHLIRKQVKVTRQKLSEMARALC